MNQSSVELTGELFEQAKDICNLLYVATYTVYSYCCHVVSV